MKAEIRELREEAARQALLAETYKQRLVEAQADVRSLEAQLDLACRVFIEKVLPL